MFFFFNDTATTEIYTLSLHDALPIYRRAARDAAPRGRVPLSRSGNRRGASADRRDAAVRCGGDARLGCLADRSEEHTSELQSRLHLVCRLFLLKKKKNYYITSRPSQS